MLLPKTQRTTLLSVLTLHIKYKLYILKALSITLTVVNIVAQNVSFSDNL